MLQFHSPEREIGTPAPAPIAEPFTSTSSPSRKNSVLLHGPQALRQLAQGWSALQDKTGASPMSRIEWVQAYLDSYAQARPGQVKIATLESQGELTAVLPLVQRRVLGLLPYLEMLGSHELYEPTELLYRDPITLAQLLDTVLQETGQPLVFERHPGNAASLDIITSQLRNAWKIRRRPRPASPSVLIGDDPEHVLNAGRRSDLRRMLRRAEKQGPVNFRILTPTLEELPALLETAMRIEAAGWKGETQTALRDDAIARNFFERYAQLATQAGIFRIAFMDIAGRTVASQLTVECGGSIWLFRIGYDEAYADCSPGNLLMMEVIRYASRQKLKSCEFLGKAEDWTRMWTNNQYDTECITIFPTRLSYLRHLCVLALEKAGDLMRNESFDKPA